MLSPQPRPGAVRPGVLPPILFVHGTFGHAGVFAPWVRFFESAGFECHAPSLPGRDPSDRNALRDLALPDYLAALVAIRDAMRAPPIVIGHSMGGLLGQQLAAATPCAALVCVASAPPGVLWAQPRALPHLARLLPAILAGRVLLPSERTVRSVVVHDLPEVEQQVVVASLVPDSGRAFRSMILGLNRIPRARIDCPVLCVSGAADRNVSGRLSRAIARRYRAEHHVFPGRGHWLVAASGVDEVPPVILDWLRRLPPAQDRGAPPEIAEPRPPSGVASPRSPSG